MVKTRLIVWAPCQKPGTSHLPTLDPDSLYAASILQARRVPNYSIGAPSSLLHNRVPCLEEIATGVALAQDIPGIERYSRKHEGIDSLLLDDNYDGEDESDIDNRERKRQWAQTKAMQRYILSTLHPLIYQVLFSQELYFKHTANVYQSGLSLMNRGSLINRLRREMREHYAIKAKAMEESRDTELCAILAESNATQYIRQEEERERQDLADRGGIARDGNMKARLGSIRGDGLLQEEKASAAKAFSEMRLQTYASKLFDILAEALGSNDFFCGSTKPSLVDLRLFSLLAPMLLPTSLHSKLASTSITVLLRSSYPTLLAHTERVQRLVWPIDVQPMLESNTSSRGEITSKHFVSTPNWPEIVGRQDETIEEPLPTVSIRLASGLGRICGHTYYYASSMISSLKDQPREEVVEQKAKVETKKVVLTQAEKAEARKVAIGRWIWITSAVVGLIGTAFASGLLAIAFVDNEADDEEEEDEEEALEELVHAQLTGKGEIDDSQEELVDDKETVVDEEDDFEIIVVDEAEVDEEEEGVELDEE